MTKTYFNERAASWDEINSERDTSKLERMAERLDIKPGSALLDVGTGTGVFLPFILNQVGAPGRIIALDFAEKMLRKVRAKGFNGDIDYLQADVTNLPLRAGIFDIVVCYSSFPHFRDKPRALAEMNRVIKSGGRLLICHTSSRAQINEIHRQVLAVSHDTLPAGNKMKAMLSMAGFVEIKIEDDSDSYLTCARKPKRV